MKKNTTTADRLTDAARCALAGAETWDWLAGWATDPATQVLAIQHAGERRIAAAGLLVEAAIAAAAEGKLNRRRARRAA